MLSLELDQHRHQHDTPGTVSLIIKSAEIRPVKKKLVAMKGKLITVEVPTSQSLRSHVLSQEGRAIGPNGTAFVITTAPVPALDTTNLVIGRIVDGIDVIQNLQTLPTVKDNTGLFLLSKIAQDCFQVPCFIKLPSRLVILVLILPG